MDRDIGRFECGGGARRCGQWNHLGGGGGGTTHAATEAEVKERRTCRTRKALALGREVLGF